MREIKFRAWHKVDNFMLEPKYIKHLDWNDETIHYIGGNYALYEYDNIDNVNYFWKGDKFVDKHETVCDVYFSDIELMQFTGLFDKQGIEIYEGDIVKFIPSGEYGKVTTFGKSQNLGIEWENSKTTFFTPMFYLGCESELEIIGNIYEHSYLLDNN